MRARVSQELGRGCDQSSRARTKALTSHGTLERPEPQFLCWHSKGLEFALVGSDEVIVSLGGGGDVN